MMTKRNISLQCLILLGAATPASGWQTMACTYRTADTALAFVPGTVQEDLRHTTSRDEPDAVIHKDTDDTEKLFEEALFELKEMMNHESFDVGPPFDHASNHLDLLEGPRARPEESAMRTPREAHYLLTAMDSSKKMFDPSWESENVLDDLDYLMTYSFE